MGGYSSTNFNSALDGSEWSVSRPGRFTPEERSAGTRWRGGWVGPRAVLDAVEKRKIPSPRRESNPTKDSTIQKNTGIICLERDSNSRSLCVVSPKP